MGTLSYAALGGLGRGIGQGVQTGINLAVAKESIEESRRERNEELEQEQVDSTYAIYDILGESEGPYSFGNDIIEDWKQNPEFKNWKNVSVAKDGDIVVDTGEGDPWVYTKEELNAMKRKLEPKLSDRAYRAMERSKDRKSWERLSKDKTDRLTGGIGGTTQIDADKQLERLLDMKKVAKEMGDTDTVKALDERINVVMHGEHAGTVEKINAEEAIITDRQEELAALEAMWPQFAARKRRAKAIRDDIENRIGVVKGLYKGIGKEAPPRVEPVTVEDVEKTNTAGISEMFANKPWEQPPDKPPIPQAQGLTFEQLDTNRDKTLDMNDELIAGADFALKNPNHPDVTPKDVQEAKMIMAAYKKMTQPKADQAVMGVGGIGNLPHSGFFK